MPGSLVREDVLTTSFTPTLQQEGVCTAATSRAALLNTPQHSAAALCHNCFNSLVQLTFTLLQQAASPRSKSTFLQQISKGFKTSSHFTLILLEHSSSMLSNTAQ